MRDSMAGGALVSTGIVTSWRLPVIPSITVTVCPLAGVVALFSPAAEDGSLAAAGAALGRAASAAFAPGAPVAGARGSADTITKGSPPSGSLANTNQPANTTRQNPSTPATAWVHRNGSWMRHLAFGSWPRGALSSSAV